MSRPEKVVELSAYSIILCKACRKELQSGETAILLEKDRSIMIEPDEACWQCGAEIGEKI